MTTEPEESPRQSRMGNILKITLDGRDLALRNLLTSDGYAMEKVEVVDVNPEKPTVNENDQIALDLADSLSDLCNRLEKILRSKNKTVSATVGGRRVNVTHVGRATLEEIYTHMDRGYRMLDRYVSIKYDQSAQLEAYEASIRELKQKNDDLETYNTKLTAMLVEQSEEVEAMRQELETLKRGLGGDELRRGKRVL